ncbi:hypothetical protein BDF19DRAFT_450693 [Syncephalis fuscata]|nr:hypothetical protein BDF19DRAFT_450693 [Syncephalis fuscata]
MANPFHLCIHKLLISIIYVYSNYNTITNYIVVVIQYSMMTILYCFYCYFYSTLLWH